MKKWIVRHYRLTIALLSVLGIAFAFLLNSDLFREETSAGDIVRLVITVLAALFFAWAIASLARSLYMNQGVRKMSEECDPTSFLAVMDDLYPRFVKGNFGRVVLMNHAEALRLKGDARGALAAHLEIPYSEKWSAAHRVVYFNNLVAFRLQDECKDIPGAIAAREEFEKILTNEKFNEGVKKQLIAISAVNRAALLSEQGATAEAEAILMGMDLNGLSRLAQLTRMMGLAENNCKSGDYERAIPQLKYVIENGNRMPDIEKAKRLLADAESFRKNENEGDFSRSND